MEPNENEYVDDYGKMSRIGKMEIFRDDNHRIEKPAKIVQRVLEAKYPRMSQEDSRRIITEMIVKPADMKIKVEGDDIRIDSLNLYVANSIESINSGSSDYGASSKSEYFGWIEEGQKIINDMNTNGVTPQELEIKHKFLSDFEQREVDLMTCLALYRRCNLADPEVKKKYDELEQKLVKLREIRSAVQVATPDKADREVSNPVENARRKALALVYTGVLTELATEAKGGMSRLTEGQKRDLNIYFEPYVNVQYVYASIMRDAKAKDYYCESKAETFALERIEKQTPNRESLMHKLAVLSGRISENLGKKASPVEQKQRAFDINRYMMLKKMQEENNLQRA